MKTLKHIILLVLISASLTTLISRCAQVGEARRNTRFETELASKKTLVGMMLPRGRYQLGVSLEPQIMQLSESHDSYLYDGVIKLKRLSRNIPEVEYKYTITNNNWTGEYIIKIAVEEDVASVQVECISLNSNETIRAYFTCRNIK